MSNGMKPHTLACLEAVRLSAQKITHLDSWEYADFQREADRALDALGKEIDAQKAEPKS